MFPHCSGLVSEKQYLTNHEFQVTPARVNIKSLYSRKDAPFSLAVHFGAKILPQLNWWALVQLIDQCSTTF